MLWRKLVTTKCVIAYSDQQYFVGWLWFDDAAVHAIVVPGGKYHAMLGCNQSLHANKKKHTGKKQFAVPVYFFEIHNLDIEPGEA
jgi:hypothetical protein